MPLERSLEILDRLIAFRTVTGNSNLELVGYARSLLHAAGAEIHVISDEAGTKANLYASLGMSGASGMLLSGHTDVVPVKGQTWSSDPFQLTRRGDRLFGRGTADMKGFVACALAAMESAAPRSLARPICLALSYDEEIGCVGVRSLIDMLASLTERPGMCIVGEPSGMEPVIGHKGKISGRVTCTGRECHSSEAPHGLNAIQLAAEMLNGIRQIQGRIEASGLHDPEYSVPFTTLHVGTIHGGTALNIVPRECSFEFEIRNVPEEDPQQILREMRDLADGLTERVSRRFPDSGVSIDLVNSYPGLMTEPDEEAVRFVSEWTGRHVPRKVSFGTEGGLFRERLGVPTVVCGPGDIAQAHKPDEFVTLDQIRLCDTMLRRMLESLAT